VFGGTDCTHENIDFFEGPFEASLFHQIDDGNVMERFGFRQQLFTKQFEPGPVSPEKHGFSCFFATICRASALPASPVVPRIPIFIAAFLTLLQRPTIRVLVFPWMQRGKRCFQLKYDSS
jgi:hypothetical protein